MLGLSRFGVVVVVVVGQWPCAVDGYVSRIHDANSSLIGHRHDPRPSYAHAQSVVRAMGFYTHAHVRNIACINLRVLRGIAVYLAVKFLKESRQRMCQK